MRGARVVVPTPGQATMLKLLHSSHNGVVKMKALARSYIWWPGIDQQIENIAQHCGQCEENARQPTRAPLRPWMFPQRPWSRVHVDCGQDDPGGSRCIFELDRSESGTFGNNASYHRTTTWVVRNARLARDHRLR